MKKLSLLLLSFLIIFFNVLFSQTVEYSNYFKKIQNLPLTGEILWESPQLSVVIEPENSFEFKVVSSNDGYWNLKIDYQVLSNEFFPPELSVEINGQFPFSEAQSITLIQYWQYETYDFPKNRYGDEMVPSQHTFDIPISYVLQDSTKIYRYPLWFKLKQGENRIKITLKSGKIKLLKVSVERPKSLETYKLKINSESSKDDIVMEK